MDDTATARRELSVDATPYVLERLEPDVCSHCLTELRIIPDASSRGWSCVNIYEGAMYINGVHGCFPISRLAEDYRSEVEEAISAKR